MRFSAIVSAAVLALAPVAMAQSSVLVSYDTFYGYPTAPVSAVTCGPFFESVGWTQLQNLPRFPSVGGMANFTTDPTFDSCMTCYTLEYNGNYVTVHIIDTADEGFVISEQAMTVLTGNITEYPVITATVGEGFMCPQ